MFRSLTSAFAYIRHAQIMRSARWHKQGTREWLITDWGNALAGETGELCNKLKKLQRLRDGLQAKRDENITELGLINEIAKEAADVFLYLDLVCAELDIDLARAIVLKFNVVSAAENFPERLYLEMPE